MSHTVCRGLKVGVCEFNRLREDVEKTRMRKWVVIQKSEVVHRDTNSSSKGD